MYMQELQGLKPQNLGRRIVVIGLLIFLSVFIGATLAAATWIALTASFGLYISIFFVTTQIMTFATVTAIVGSYIFNSKFETEAFFDLVKNVAPRITLGNSVAATKDELMDNIKDNIKDFTDVVDTQTTPK